MPADQADGQAIMLNVHEIQEERAGDVEGRAEQRMPGTNPEMTKLMVGL